MVGFIIQHDKFISNVNYVLPKFNTIALGNKRTLRYVGHFVHLT